jgi:hypothetical protein
MSDTPNTSVILGPGLTYGQGMTHEGHINNTISGVYITNPLELQVPITVVTDIPNSDNSAQINIPTVLSGVKHDQEKSDMSLLSAIAMVKIAQVMTFGKKKYSAHNWRGGIVYSRLLAAALRHLFAYLGGESKDPETGLSHLAHAACCIMMLLEFEDTRTDLDDRYKEIK